MSPEPHPFQFRRSHLSRSDLCIGVTLRAQTTGRHSPFNGTQRYYFLSPTKKGKATTICQNTPTEVSLEKSGGFSSRASNMWWPSSLPLCNVNMGYLIKMFPIRVSISFPAEF
ncbi:hypothetical protein TNCV_2377091 [Trichonephila clavipes]|nr:hypothetical protein TNCV_2377091 [Trichonephila clavipes]